MTLIALFLALLAAVLVPGGFYVANLAMARATTLEVPQRTRVGSERN